MEFKETRNKLTGVRAETKLEISKSGRPCLWEMGGGRTKTGSVQIICDKNGEAKKAIYVPTHGNLCNGKHALIPVKVGDIVIEYDVKRGHYQVLIWEIIRIEDETADLLLIESLECKGKKGDKTHSPIPQEISCVSGYHDALSAAATKASTYHCKGPFYIR